MNAPAQGRWTGEEAVPVLTPQASYMDRDQLVIAHVGLVKAMAHRLAQRLPAQVEMTDLISVGVMVASRWGAMFQ